MQEKILNGKFLAQQILDKIGLAVNQLTVDKKRLPCLAVILVGNDPASEVYVRNKKQACNKVGIKSLEFKLSALTSQSELLDLINQLNSDETIDGILVQLPLPKHLDSKLIIDIISPNKDVDGFSRYNMGSLALNNSNICPCTPQGIIYILNSINTQYHGKHAVILGSSTIVGRPMALELINRGATVTVCNSKTQNLRDIVINADILIAAIGKANFVHGSWLKKDSVVIDVGINRLANGNLCGDVDFATAIGVVKHITPVPGGVGPMTIAMLMQNTLNCYKLKQKE